MITFPLSQFPINPNIPFSNPGEMKIEFVFEPIFNLIPSELSQKPENRYRCWESLRDTL